VRIFNRTAEMPFAGHPNVGTGWVLAQEGRDRDGVLLFEEIAGLVEVRALRDGGAVTGARISAPQPLSTGAEVAPELVAACVGLAPPADLVTRAHRPVVASVGNSFVIAEVAPDALPRAVPDLAAFRRAAPQVPELGPGRLPIYLYARDGARLRARMFSPLSGTVEDAATGSAATPLAALLLRLSGQECAEWDIVQGVEMGRPSLLRTSAWQAEGGIRAAVAGGCVRVLQGEAEL
jgi:trans-2,3-dihydro-3-hydroxyanthranilate isomerase